ncbi:MULTISPECIES: helix-turn-helix transcriptional regulator [Flavobacterium]|uniref:Helix-turn-helix transcriptional regulator n=1 Tax=Flavobacterium jumunjinense TaxID=998845 RepID=A0ABV5GKA9_9FLAO|nr:MULTISPECIES: helix-turn-helix transcriptional regulator [Flavobacterium]
MEKTKLIESRKRKGLSQQQMAEHLCMDVSNYNRREKGQIKIHTNEWEKIASLLEVAVEEIYENEDANFFVFRDNSKGTYLGTNHIYSIPDHLLESQRKYIAKLEEEIKELKEKLKL